MDVVITPLPSTLSLVQPYPCSSTSPALSLVDTRQGHSDQSPASVETRSSVVLQELGHCEIKNCNWAHGVDDLDTSAFAYDFPQAHTGPENQWAEVAKQKLGKLKTGPSSLNGGNK